MPRYYRLTCLAPRGNGALRLGSIQLGSAGLPIAITGITATTAPESGDLSALNSATPGAGCQWSAKDAASPGFAIVIDCGADVAAETITLGAALGSIADQWPLMPLVETSNTGTTWSYVQGVPSDAELDWPGGGNTVKVLVRTWLKNGKIVLWMPCNQDQQGDIARSAPITKFGNAAISSAQGWSKGQSYDFPTEGSALSTPLPSNSPLHFGAGDFSVAFKVFARLTRSGYILSWSGGLNYSWPDLSMDCVAQSASTWRIQIAIRSAAAAPNGAPDISYFQAVNQTLPGNQWVRVLLTRESGNFKLYINGQVAWSLNDSRAIAATTNLAGLGIGGGGWSNLGRPAECFDGFIDDIIIARGAAGLVPDDVPTEAPGYTETAARGRLPIPVCSLSGESADQILAIRHPILSARARDIEFSGEGRIYGTVSRKNTPANTPLSRRVRLHRSIDGYLARETWSKADGSYEFREISTRYEWDVIAWDHELQEYSTVANNQLAEPMP